MDFYVEFENPETMEAKKVVSLHRAINVGAYFACSFKTSI